MADHQDLVAQFCSLTSANPQQADFFLSANNWNLEGAVTSFFDNPSAMDVDQPQTGAQPNPSSSSSSSTQNPASATGNPPPVNKPRIATFSDMTSQSEPDTEGGVPNEYFAGGGKNSGISIQDPNVKKTPAANLVADILKKASENTPRPEGDEDEDESDDEFLKDHAQPKRPPAFTGAGYRLGSEEDGNQPSQPIGAPLASPSASSSTYGGAEKEKSGKVTRVLTFWKNGFSIDDGELKSYDDPVNQEFLNAIKSGRAPTQFLNVKYGQPVDLKVEQRFQEDYKPPPMKPFSGSGHRLGSVVPNDPSIVTPGAFPTSPTTASASTAAATPASSFSLNLDESQPITTIQIRLGDGTRMVSKFNHTHTVGDIRNFIQASRPSSASRRYVLQTTFPNREITDEKLSIKDANLINAVVVQKYV